VLDKLDDIASDLSAFHRIDDYRDMDSARFFMLALRLPAYRGVCRARIEGEQAKKQGNGGTTTNAQREVTVDYNDPTVAQYFDEG